MSFVKKYYHIVIFALFLFLEAVVIWQITQFGDDYYYMTFLSDGAKNFFELNVSHYLEVNGRAFVHLIDELILADRSLTVWRIVGTALIGSTVWLLALVAVGGERRSENFPAALICCCVLFSILDVMMLNETFYWITGAMNYALPLPVLLSYYLLYKRFTKTKKLPAFTFVLAFFSCAMIEQCAFTSLLITAAIIYTFVLNKKKPEAALILCVLFSVAGFAFLFLAPGNAVRKTYYPDFYEMSLYKRIISNIKPLASMIFSRRGSANVIVAYLVFGGARKIAVKKRASVALGAAEILSAILVLIHVYVGGVMTVAVSAAVLTVLMLCADIVLSLPALKDGDTDGLFFCAVPLILQAAMLVSPLFGARTILCSAVLLFVPTAKNAAYLVGKLKNEKVKIASASVAAALAFLLFIPLISGYSENRKIQMYNIKNASSCAENGGGLVYYYMPREQYRYVLPYDNSYHEYWFKKAYGLPESTEIIYMFYE